MNNDNGRENIRTLLNNHLLDKGRNCVDKPVAMKILESSYSRIWLAALCKQEKFM